MKGFEGFHLIAIARNWLVTVFYVLKQEATHDNMAGAL